MSEQPQEVMELAVATNFIEKEVAERADTFDFDDKALLIDGLATLRKQIDTATALLRGEMTKELEAGARQVGTKVYARVPKFKESHNHDKVVAIVGRIARETAPVDETTGEIDHTRDGERAAALMRRLYLADSSKVKVTELKRIDVPRKEIITRERNGHEIQVTDLDPEDDE